MVRFNFILLLLFALLIKTELALSKEFTADDFKGLAMDMLATLKKSYGKSYLDNQVLFAFDNYENIIARTSIQIKKEKLFLTDKTTGELKRVHAINYFPSQELIEIDEAIWSQKLNENKLNEIKLMIHHEFVPYFKKTADINLVHNDFVNKVLNQVNWLDLESGFYEAIYFNDPAMKYLLQTQLIFITAAPNLRILELTTVQNPKVNIWCLECFLFPTSFNLNVINEQQPYLNVNTNVNNPLLASLIGNSEAKPVFRIFDRSTLGIAIITSNSANLEHEKWVVYKKIKKVQDLIWKKPDKTVFNSIEIDNKNACLQNNNSKSKLVIDDICNDSRLKSFYGLDHEKCLNTPDTIIYLKPEEKEMGCYVLRSRELIPEPTWYPISYDRYATLIKMYESFQLSVLLENIHNYPRN